MRESPLPRLLLVCALLALLYFCAARLGLLLAFESTNVSPVWIPSGIALAALLLLGKRVWPGVIIGAMAANAVVFQENGALQGIAALGVALAIASGNTLEGLATVFLLGKLMRDPRALRTPGQVYIFVGGCACGAALGAVSGTTILVSSGLIPAAAVPMIAATWWVGDLAGMLIVTPLMLAWRGAGRPALSAIRAGLAPMLVLLAVLGTLFSLPPSAGSRMLVFILLPCIGWAAYRYRQRGAATQHQGPFTGGSRTDALFALEVFIGLSSVVGMVLAADADEYARRGVHMTSMRGAWPHWIGLFGGLMLSVSAWQFVTSDTEQRSRDVFAEEVRELRRRVAERIEAYAQILEGGRAVISTAGKVSRSDWHHYVTNLEVERKYPGFQVIGVARYTADKQALEREVHAEGYPGFGVWPPGVRANYAPIVFPEPFHGMNLRAFGFDMMAEPIRRAALLRAMESGKLAVTGKVRLIQEHSAQGQAGFLMYVPVYRRGVPQATWDERSAALEYFVYSAFRMDDLMADILTGTSQSVALEVYDGYSTAVDARMYASPALLRNPEHEAAFSNAASMAVGDTLWLIRVSSLPAFESAIDSAKGLIVLFAGTVISLLLFSMMRAMSVTREDALALASNMTGALRESEHRFAVLVDSASEFSIIATDLQGIITVFSVGAERMLGYVAAELVGIATPAILHDQAEVERRSAQLSAELGRPVHGFEVFVARAAMRQAETVEWTYVRKDGSRLPVQLTVTAILDASDAVVGFLGIARDVTEQKLAEQNLRWAMTQADAGSRAKSEFVANMSHELRTPLNAVLGMAQLLSRSALNEEQHKDLDTIRSSGASLLAILNDILDFSKIEAGKMALACLPFRMEELLASLATMMSLNARGHALTLTIALDPAVPATLLGDALRLQQILVNLAGNAIKFTRRGHVAVRIDALALQGDAVRLRIEVDDSGIGMTPAQVDALFSPFTQADSSTTRRFGGTGLGLTITRRLVRLMDGTITVRSSEGVGSNFSVELALARDPTAGAAAPDGLLQDLPVLVADAVPASALVLEQTLASLGCRALRAAAPWPAVPDTPVRVVMLDLALCGAEPAAAIARLRATSSAAIVLMLSFYERSKAQFDPAALGADDVLDKPVTAAPLRHCLHNLLLRGDRPVPAAGAVAGPELSCRVLLVEDNFLNQEVARRLLVASGARVDIAGDGRVALSMLGARPDAYDLILMDIQMPVMDGFETIAHIRDQLGMATPVIAMTAGVMEHERERCIAAGMNGFIAKPLALADMLAEIRRVLGQEGCTPAAPQAGAADGVFGLNRLLDNATDQDGMRHIMAGLIAGFVERATTPLDDLPAAWREGRAEEAGRVLHGLRGSIGSLGAQRFADACMALEHGLHAGADAQALDALLLPVRSEMEATLAAAAAWLAQTGETAPRGATPLSASELALLRGLLAERNLAACARFDALATDMRQCWGEAALAQLQEAMDKLDFALAIALLDNAAAGAPIQV
ncbi:MAG: CHASE domain-containing protein [Pseudomonadota bacterium]